MRSLSMSYIVLFTTSGRAKKLNSEFDISFVALCGDLVVRYNDNNNNNNYDIMQCAHLPSGG